MKEQELEHEISPLIGKRLVRLREKHGFTQEELAEKLGVSRQAISKWESNRAFPNIDKLFYISELYQVSLDYLLKGQDYEPLKEEETELAAKQEALAAEQAELAAKQEALVAEQAELAVKQEAFVAEQAELAVKQEAGDLTSKAKAYNQSEKKTLYVPLAAVLIGMLFIINGAIIVMLLMNQNWNTENETAAVYVDTIYEQYTKAKVVIPNEDGSYVEKTLWLDHEGIREHDWGWCYYNEGQANGIKTDYNRKTLLIPILTAGILLVLFLLLCLEMRKRYESKEE